MPMTIGDAVDWWGIDAPGRLAIAYEDDRITYGALKAWTDRVAAFLAAEGIRAGDRVAIYDTNSLNWCATALGIIKTGAMVVPFNYRHTVSELVSVAADCAPKVVIVGSPPDERAQALAPLGCAFLSIDAVRTLREGPAIDFALDIDPAAPAVISYTSGSTAQPKGVVHSHQTMLAHSLEALLTDAEWVAGKKVLGPSPLYTGAGISTLVKYTTLGLQTFLMYGFDAEKALRILTEEKIDSFGGVPTFFERIAALQAFAHADLSHIKYASVGGARVPTALLGVWRERGVILRQIYGLTEAAGNTTIMDREGAAGSPEKCGRGRPFTKHKIVDSNFVTCPPGQPGEILLRGPTVMLGYWNNPQATADAFVDGWLRTGDVGVMDQDGYLTVVDRLKDLIISGGLNIAPLDIENVIAQLEGVSEVAVIAAADARFGETPLAIIHASKPMVTADVIAHCNAHLADYKVPRYVVFEAEPLPRLATGKISKRELRDRYKDAARELQRVR